MNVMGDAYGAAIVYHLTKAELQLLDGVGGELARVDQQVPKTPDVIQDREVGTAEGVGSNTEKEQQERDHSPTENVDEVLEVQEVNQDHSDQDPKDHPDGGGV